MAWGSLAPTSCQNNQPAADEFPAKSAAGRAAQQNKFHLAPPPPHLLTKVAHSLESINHSFGDQETRRAPTFLARFTFSLAAGSLAILALRGLRSGADSMPLSLSLALLLLCVCDSDIRIAPERERPPRMWLWKNNTESVLDGAARPPPTATCMHTWMDARTTAAGSPNLWLCGNSRLFSHQGSEPWAD